MVLIPVCLPLTADLSARPDPKDYERSAGLQAEVIQLQERRSEAPGGK